MPTFTHHRSSSPSASSSSSQSSDSDSSRRGTYVPLHKRSPPSSTTSVSEPSSSRSASPSKRRETPASLSLPTPPAPRIYTTGYLLSLRPFATEGLKEQMRGTCAEVVMNRRMRKSIEFNENQARSAVKALLAQQRLLQQQEQQHARSQYWQQRHTYLPAAAPASLRPVHTHVSPVAMPPPQRVRLAERNSGRRPRENAIQHNTTSWNTLEDSNSPPVRVAA